MEPLDGYERMWISEPTHTLPLLLHFAASDDERRLPRVEADWTEVLKATASHGLVPLAARLLKRQAVDGYPPEDFIAELQQRYLSSTVRMMLMYRRIAGLLRALTQTGLEFIVLKGPTLGTTVYPDPSLRIFNDLDVLVRERDWAAADRALKSLGFVPERDLPEPPPKLILRAVLYEHKYCSAHDGFLVEVHYDDVLNAGLATRDIEGFWQRAVTVSVEDVTVRTLCVEDQLIHLCAHTHYHGYTRLNWLSDLAFFLRHYVGQIDWQQLIATTRQEGAEVPVYYSLYYLEGLLNVAAPPDVLSAIKPDPFRRWVHNAYLREKHVLSMQPMSRPTFSLYFRPVLRRLLPDLLVMGRRPEKLWYLFRLLAPPRDWLAYYYSLDPSESILIHYLLHPLKLFWHTAHELYEEATRTLYLSYRRTRKRLRRQLERQPALPR